MAGTEYNVTVDFSAFERITNQLKQAIPNAISDFGQEVIGTVEQKSPRKTGNLASGWTLTQQGDKVVIENNVSYASYVVNGTRAHDIYPKGNVLAFEYKGHMVFAKHVHHPGTKPNDFIDQSIDQAMNVLPDIIIRALQEAGL